MNVPLPDGAVVDLDRRAVLRGEQATPLTSREAELVAYVAARPGVSITWEQLHLDVWGHAPTVTSRAAYFCWRRLQSKLALPDDVPNPFKTQYGTGVCYQPPDTPTPPAHSGPQQRAFFGRAEALATLDRLQAERLLTIHGPGGMGKSRLLRHWLVQRQRDHLHIDLSDATGRQALERIARRLEVSAAPDGLPAAIGRVLRLEDRLVALDNADAAVPELVGWLTGWLRDAPTLQVWLTSRIRTALMEEVVVRLGPLDTASSVQLFAHRVRRSHQSWDVTPHVDTVAEIAERLDGLPLALELAAARTGTRSPQRVLEGLEHRFRLLRSRGAGGQRSLWEVVSWSWNLLRPELQRLFAALSVFRGSFSLDDAEAILPLPDVADGVEALVDRALVHVDADALHEVRFRVYSTLREYAERHLSDRAELQAKHAEHYAAWARDLLPTLERTGDADLEGLLLLQEDNLRAAATFALDSAPEQAAWCLLALQVLHAREARPSPQLQLDTAACAERVDGELLARLRLAYAMHAMRAGKTAEALSAVTSAVQEATTSAFRGEARIFEASVIHRRGQPAEALARLEALDLAGLDAAGVATYWQIRGLVLVELARYDPALEAHRRAIEAWSVVGNRKGATNSRVNLAYGLLMAGRVDEALPVLHTAVETLEADGRYRALLSVLNTLGAALCERGHVDAAEGALAKARGLVPTSGNAILHGQVLTNLGNVYRERDDLEQAIALHRESLALHLRAQNHFSAALAAINLATDTLESDPTTCDAWLQAASEQLALAPHRRLAAALAAVRLLRLVVHRDDDPAAREQAQTLADEASAAECHLLIEAADIVVSARTASRDEARLQRLLDQGNQSQIVRWGARVASRMSEV